MAQQKRPNHRALSDQTNQGPVQPPKQRRQAKPTPPVTVAVTSASEPRESTNSHPLKAAPVQKQSNKGRQAQPVISAPPQSVTEDERDELARLRREVEELKASQQVTANSSGGRNNTPTTGTREKPAAITPVTPREPAIPPKRRHQEKTSTALQTVTPRNTQTATRESLLAADTEEPSDNGNKDDTTHHNRGHTNQGKQKKPKIIEEPRGTYSIQVAMGLAGTAEKNKLYLSIRRKVQDLTVKADLPWELPYNKMPTERLAMFYKAAREEVKWLARCKNDWATKALAMQYMKNRRKEAYKKGTLAVPDKYKYLAANSAKRSASGSRIKKATLIMAENESRATPEHGAGGSDEMAHDSDNDGPPRKRQRLSTNTNSSFRAQQPTVARTTTNNPEFVQGSSRDYSPCWDARPEVDDDYIPGCSDDEGDVDEEDD